MKQWEPPWVGIHGSRLMTSRSAIFLLPALFVAALGTSIQAGQSPSQGSSLPAQLFGETPRDGKHGLTVFPQGTEPVHISLRADGFPTCSVPAGTRFTGRSRGTAFTG